MMDNFYDGDKIIEKFGKYGDIELNEHHAVARILPHIENRIEVIVDSSIPEDTPLDDIPPHLKQTIELYFVNIPAIYPEKGMIQCVSPGVLETFTGKVWEKMPYREEWAAWEQYVAEMQHIEYPFTVLPSEQMYPRTWRLMDRDKMELFKTLLTGNNRQVTIQELNARWAQLFHPDNYNSPDHPIAAWLAVSETPSAYVDVVEMQADRTAKILFTVPPLMSLNEGMSSIMAEKKSINIESMIMRSRSESQVIPNSGDQRIVDTLGSNQAEPELISKHAEMWRHIFKLYKWSFVTEGTDSVSTNNTTGSNADDKYDDEMEDIIF